MRRVVILLLALLSTGPALADPAIEAAFRDANAALDRALPNVDGQTFGVELSAFQNALLGRPFASVHWGGMLQLQIVRSNTKTGACGSYAAFVDMPPKNGAVTLTFCPEFFTPGTEALRALTVLHEVVHAVAGPDECRAMAFAAQVEYFAMGQYTPVERYWRANNCARSGFSLP